MTLSLSPQEAWQPLPAAQWNADTARHLLRRAGWTARPADVDRAVSEGCEKTIARLFPLALPKFEKPRLAERLEKAAAEAQRDSAKATTEDRLRLQRESQERSRIALQELSLKWLQYAAAPESAALAKWVLFLSDVYVVSTEKVRNPGAIFAHFDTLLTLGLGPAPELTKAISRSPAMVVYLDLNQSQRKSPNENFARELFELFVLGEGNYTEQDIKEAARAFTGYRAQGQQNEFRYIEAQHDPTEKTVFGATGKFKGDDIIELAYSQKAAATFLPKEMAANYLSDAAPLPREHLETLGATWRESGFDLRVLVQRFFGSRLFYAPEFRGNFIKSPVQFYLGAVQDLDLQVPPLPRFTLNPLRQMGQQLFQPPNVRGWVGGRQWINSSTLTARRLLVEAFFTPIDEKSLNGDEFIEMVAAKTNGLERFVVTDTPLAPYAAQPPAEAATALATSLLAGPPAAETRDNLGKFLSASAADPKQRLQRIRRAAVTLMQSPEYQLC